MWDQGQLGLSVEAIICNRFEEFKEVFSEDDRQRAYQRLAQFEYFGEKQPS
jgi:hypothetical protein